MSSALTSSRRHGWLNATRRDHHRPASVHLLPDGYGAALRGDPPRLGRSADTEAQQQDPARRGHPHRPRARGDMRPATRRLCRDRPRSRAARAQRRPLDRRDRDPTRDPTRLQRHHLQGRTRPHTRIARVKRRRQAVAQRASSHVVSRNRAVEVVASVSHGWDVAVSDEWDWVVSDR
jgi:hypothetical protein